MSQGFTNSERVADVSEEQKKAIEAAIDMLREASSALAKTGGMLHADIAREATRVARRLEILLD